MVEKNQQISYQQAQTFFQRLSSLHGASTWQGWLTGYLVAGFYDERPWYEHAMQWLDIELEIPLSEQDVHFLDTFHRQIATQLKHQDQALVFLLPPKQLAMSERVAALRFWAESFLLGFAALPIKGESLSKNLNEALADISKISQADVGDEEIDHKTLEVSYAAIVEHIQLLIDVIRAELVFNSDDDSNVVH